MGYTVLEPSTLIVAVWELTAGIARVKVAVKTAKFCSFSQHNFELGNFDLK
jgi:hypothetical protein